MDGRRITEAGDSRITESGDRRITENALIGLIAQTAPAAIQSAIAREVFKGQIVQVAPVPTQQATGINFGAAFGPIDQTAPAAAQSAKGRFWAVVSPTENEWTPVTEDEATWTPVSPTETEWAPK